MRILLRDAASGLYFREPDDWTAETEQAQAFKHSAEAMDRARQHGLKQGEVVLSFDESRLTVALPLP